MGLHLSRGCARSEDRYMYVDKLDWQWMRFSVHALNAFQRVAAGDHMLFVVI